jgi:hypothetical protein
MIFLATAEAADLLTYWPVLLALLSLAAGLGAALTKIADLRKRVDRLESQMTEAIQHALADIRGDIRELMALVKGRGDERPQGERRAEGK